MTTGDYVIGAAYTSSYYAMKNSVSGSHMDEKSFSAGNSVTKANLENSDNYKNDSAAHYIIPDDNTESLFVCDELSQIRNGGCVNCTRIFNPVC